MADLTTRVARTVGRHFVTLSCIQLPSADAQPKPLIFSGFLVDILGEWFYVTAGHILRYIDIALASGSEFDAWRLDDQTAGNHFSGKAVPYAFDVKQWFVLQDDTQGFDYAIVHLAPFYRRQLEAGGATPIAKAIWSDHVVPANYWVLVGIPSESVRYDGESAIRARVVVAPLRPAETPDLADQRAENQFYATPLDGSEAFFEDADGFSGGPVFALKKVEDRWCYGVIGVQSAWYRSSRTMAICPFTSFVSALEPVVAETIEEHQRSVGNSAA
jgi:hypothetical protein